MESGLALCLPIVIGQSCIDLVADKVDSVNEEYFYNYPLGEQPSIPRVSAGDFAWQADAFNLDESISGNKLENLLGDNDDVAVFKFPAKLVVHFTNERKSKGYDCLYIGGNFTNGRPITLSVSPAWYAISYAKEIVGREDGLFLGKYAIGDILSSGNYTPGISGVSVPGGIREKNEIGIKLGELRHDEMLYIFAGAGPQGLSSSARFEVRSLRAGIMPSE